MLGAGELAANALRHGADLVRPGMCSISAGIAALAIGVFLGSQVPISPGMHVASLETYLASDLEERESSPELPAPPRASFDERFAGAAVSPGSAPARTVETEAEGADNQPLQPPERATAHPAVGDSVTAGCASHFVTARWCFQETDSHRRPFNGLELVPRCRQPYCDL